MDLSDLGAILFFGVLLICVVLPITIIRHDRPTLQPVRLRQKLVRWSAILSGLPLLAIIFWDHIGIPPSHGAAVVTLLFFVAIGTPLILLLINRHLLTGSPTGIVFAFLGFCLVIFAEVLTPPTLTVVDIYSKPVSRLATPIEPDACTDQTVKPLLAHISDLHISDRERTRDNSYPGNDRLAPVLQRINSFKPPYLVVSGDITDEETAPQWRLVENLLTPLNRNTTILSSTGNHDLNYFFGKDPTERPWTWFGLFPLTGIDGEPRIFRAAEFQARHLSQMLTTAGTSLGNTIANVPTESNLALFKDQIAECAISCLSNAATPDEARSARAVCTGMCAHDLDSIRFHYYHDLSKLFPLTYVDTASHTAFIAMTTSMAESTSVGRNAIGWSGDDQITHLGEALDRLPTTVKYIVIVMHHPLLWNGVPSFPSFAMSSLRHPFRAWEAFYSSPWFLAVFLHNDIGEGEQIYTMLRGELAKRPETSALILYGHRHERSLSRIGSITFAEAPNLATTEPTNYGFYLVGTKANSLSVSWCQVGGK